MAQHYICTGTCKGVSDIPGVCQDASCVKHEQQLTSCECEDGKHFGQQEAHTIDKEETTNGKSGEEKTE